jgi:hypothetical protein
MSQESVESSIRELIEITQTDDQVFVIVLAVHKDQSKNDLNKITHRKSVPLGGYVYDTANDSYHALCVDFLQLGYVPASFMLKMPGTGTWRVRVPMPETVLLGFLTTQQNKNLQVFKSIYKGDDYSFVYMQAIDSF